MIKINRIGTKSSIAILVSGLFSPHQNTIKMAVFLIIVFLIATSATGCCSFHSRSSPAAGQPLVETRPPTCPAPNKERVVRPKSALAQYLPFINISAITEVHGFCRLPYSVEELNWRVKHDPDTKYNASGLISSKGYPVQNYEVPTKDGFILGMQRIPYGKNNSHLAGPRPAVLLQHGLFACSTIWVSNLPNQSLGFILADAGFDVWLGNARGNTYSKKHQHLKETQKEFWYWSWDDMGKYDLPAMVNFILNTTGHKNISYVGHSQGTTMAFAGLSLSKELQSKINLFVALAPVANVSHMTSALKLLAPPDIYKPIMDALILTHHYQFLPHSPIFDFLANTMCAFDSTVIICQSALFLFGGYSCDHMNASRLPVYISNNPAGTSLWDVEHWAQGIDSSNFSMYDFGCQGNVDHYNQTTPPLYDVQDIDTPIALFSGGIDILADSADVELLTRVLRHVVFNKIVHTYGHLDFCWAYDAVNYVYNDVVKLLKGASGGFKQ